MKQAVLDLFTRQSLVLIAGPCAAESKELCLEVARELKKLTSEFGVGYIFKASFDKANRTSITSYRGPGIDEGLKILRAVQDELDLPTLTDIHLPEQAAPVADVVDVLQIPAFLCRQTDLIVAAAKTGKPTCIKKGQFLEPAAMQHAAAKFREAGGEHVALTERGSTFGYGNLVVDMRGLPTMAAVSKAPVIFDATHSVQQPAGASATTGGKREFVPVLARAAAAVGIDGLFCEVHPSPDKALSDGPNSLDFEGIRKVLTEVSTLDKVRRGFES
ncbi:MAG: 3-deoxy-8-phosphooctulonate synthase [Deltaproteobacteria bacterium]|nr:3-deoxy-8-phosphooctulonate synthase [Deltaproteobacteria bacterium]